MAPVPADRRRDDFIIAAVGVIAERGVSGTTTRRIADAAQAPLASLHYYFGSKEELFISIAEYIAKNHLANSLHVRPGAGLGRAAATLVRQTEAWFDRETAFARAQLELFFWAVRHDPDLTAKNYQMHLELLQSKLREGMRANDDPNLVESIARMTAAFLDGMIPQWLTFPDPVARQECSDAFAESLERLADAHRIERDA